METKTNQEIGFFEKIPYVVGCDLYDCRSFD